MTLPTILELWAERHPKLQHTPSSPANKRVFYVRSISALPDFVMTLPVNASPCVMIDIMHDQTYTSEGKKSVTYTVYFAARYGAGKANEDDMARLALETTERLIEDFRRDVIARQDDNDRDYLTIDIDFSTYPYGPLFNNWYATCLTITKTELVSLCP